MQKIRQKFCHACYKHFHHSVIFSHYVLHLTTFCRRNGLLNLYIYFYLFIFLHNLIVNDNKNILLSDIYLDFTSCLILHLKLLFNDHIISSFNKVKVHYSDLHNVTFIKHKTKRKEKKTVKELLVLLNDNPWDIKVLEIEYMSHI